MLFKIEQGLFTAEFTDYHAVLGVPVDAEPKDIRKHYLKLARRLHPDSCAKESEADRSRAAEFLSKMVNPAYEKLSDEKNYTEYQLLLKLKGQQALRQQDTIMLSSEVARKLASERGAIEAAYHNALQSLANEQYHHLDKTLELTGQISELNMIYLMRKANEGDMPTLGGPRPAQAGATKTAGAASPAATAAPPTTTQRSAPTRESIVASYLRRAQEFENKQNYTAAIKELRDGLQVDPLNGTTHCRLGVVYMKANQSTMAKVHFRKALEINPQDMVAQQGMKRLDPTGQSAAAPSPQQNAATKGAKTPPKSGKSEGGGLFGLFGGKKK